MSREVRNLLVCPRCHGELHDAANVSGTEGPRGAAEIAGFTCSGCRVTYPVEDGIPVLLVDAAREQASAL